MESEAGSALSRLPSDRWHHLWLASGMIGVRQLLGVALLAVKGYRLLVKLLLQIQGCLDTDSLPQKVDRLHREGHLVQQVVHLGPEVTNRRLRLVSFDRKVVLSTGSLPQLGLDSLPHRSALLLNAL